MEERGIAYQGLVSYSTKDTKFNPSLYLVFSKGMRRKFPGSYKDIRRSCFNSLSPSAPRRLFQTEDVVTIKLPLQKRDEKSIDKLLKKLADYIKCITPCFELACFPTDIKTSPVEVEYEKDNTLYISLPPASDGKTTQEMIKKILFKLQQNSLFSKNIFEVRDVPKDLATRMNIHRQYYDDAQHGYSILTSGLAPEFYIYTGDGLLPVGLKGEFKEFQHEPLISIPQATVSAFSSSRGGQKEEERWKKDAYSARVEKLKKELKGFDVKDSVRSYNWQNVAILRATFNATSMYDAALKVAQLQLLAKKLEKYSSAEYKQKHTQEVPRYPSYYAYVARVATGGAGLNALCNVYSTYAAASEGKSYAKPAWYALLWTSVCAGFFAAQRYFAKATQQIFKPPFKENDRISLRKSVEDISQELCNAYKEHKQFSHLVDELCAHAKVKNPLNTACN